MKFSNKIIIIILLGCFAFACSESFLDDAGEPLDTPGGDNFYNSPTTIYFGVIGIYSILHDLYDESNAIPERIEKRSDNTSDAGDTDQPDDDFTGGGNGGGIWNDAFKMISRANLMLESIEQFEGTEAQEARVLPLEAEARFLRAYVYFHLVRMFGDMIIIEEPLRNDQQILGKRREPAANLYSDVIIPDLEFAIQHALTRSELDGSDDIPGRFKNGSELGRASRETMQTLLAEVYLTIGEDALAEQVLTELYNNPDLGLLSDYADLFKVDNEYNMESIWEVGFDFQAGQGSRYFRWTTRNLRDETDTQGAVGIMEPTTNIKNAFLNERDEFGNVLPVRDKSGEYANMTRFKASMDTFAIHKNGVDTVYADYIKKFVTLGIAAQSVEQDNNYYIYRFADVILMLAEAKNNLGKTGEAINLLNEIRFRANMPNYDVNKWNGGGATAQQAFKRALLFERRMEFAFESKRWYDLLRFDMAVEVMSDYIGAPIDEHLLLFEIPDDELDKNPGIQQNPGY